MNAAERGAKANIRGDFEEELIGPIGHQVFFGEELEAVGQGLQPAEFAADARWAQAILDAAGNLALHPDEEERADRDQIHNEKDLDQRSQRISQPGPKRVKGQMEFSIKNWATDGPSYNRQSTSQPCHNCVGPIVTN